MYFSTVDRRLTTQCGPIVTVQIDIQLSHRQICTQTLIQERFQPGSQMDTAALNAYQGKIMMGLCMPFIHLRGQTFKGQSNLALI
jgi:hypothetical protein